MTRALVTLAHGGPFREALEVALPTFRAFAGRHGYRLVVADPEPVSRPVSWWKIPAILECLGSHDEVLWVDADVVIVDASRDLRVPEFFWHALVEHHTADGQVPNCGVWLVRQPMRGTLETMWGMEQYLSHPWWEQAALLELLGYPARPPTRPPAVPGELFQHTFFLDPGWNVHRNDSQAAGHPRFRHATTYGNRVSVMREWAAPAVHAVA